MRCQAACCLDGHELLAGGASCRAQTNARRRAAWGRTAASQAPGADADESEEIRGFQDRDSALGRRNRERHRSSFRARVFARSERAGSPARAVKPLARDVNSVTKIHSAEPRRYIVAPFCRALGQQSLSVLDVPIDREQRTFCRTRLNVTEQDTARR
jgi:hypothetical protein